MGDQKFDGPVDPDQARLLLARHEAVAIDLREEQAPETGHAPGAAVVLNGKLTEAAERARSGDELPVLVFCEDGERSRAAAAELREAGIEAESVAGGWDNWVANDEPVQPRRDEEFEGPDLSTQPGT